jgi:crotonobetainyl-CoA:carnitine CoA-transferase CaiB-like acyl-CoA transferase
MEHLRGNAAQFVRFCGAIGMPHLVDDARFATGVERIRNRDTLIPILERRFLEEDVAHWMAALNAADVVAGPINDMAAVFADPQVTHRTLRRPATGSAFGPLDLIANPIGFERDPIDRYRAPPTLGQHTDEVLGERLGLGRAELDELRSKAVI